MRRKTGALHRIGWTPALRVRAKPLPRFPKLGSGARDANRAYKRGSAI
jgi:hypothetical protein